RLRRNPSSVVRLPAPTMTAMSAVCSGTHAQVIVLNGGSSSGKSSIARALQELLPGIWLTFGVDTLIEALPGRGDSMKSGISYHPGGAVTVTEEYTQLEDAWYSALQALSKAGANIILDE